MQCSLTFSCWWSLLLLATAVSAACPLIGAGSDPQTKAYLAPVVFHGKLIALARRGPAQQATFRVGKVFKGSLDSPNALVEFAIRKNPARCRGVLYPKGKLQLQERYVVFAAWRRRKMIAVDEPEAYSKRKAVAKVLCQNCAGAPTVRGLNDINVQVNSKLKLTCILSGNPPPRVVWFKDELRIRADKSHIKVRSKRRNSHLVINKVMLEDGGLYKCLAKNILGNATASATVNVTLTETDSVHGDIVPCPRRNFCLNGGVCYLYASIQEYICECAEGYTGQRCEKKAISTLSNALKAPRDLNATTRLLQHYWGR
ncbi:pro-neuregulin-2, membrane-bound isoform-like isoform X2 [Stegodyphus dumicola]|uniref:pro-neuregulin-2, membrane-bound isoform-like isoform X2 n=1 Tax=Stegodyphus dumicola TaxID=202533 RepID=UPI0015ABFD5E|nr:pro-neuregulin-2, membrane-bound isoform-like isoform X2 [Stegodyphus dumicola]